MLPTQAAAPFPIFTDSLLRLQFPPSALLFPPSAVYNCRSSPKKQKSEQSRPQLSDGDSVIASMALAIPERVELAKLCCSRDWSKAIRVLDSLISQSGAVQDICNRAFCYSQLELHKHVIKDCDRALRLEPTLIQAYILKGRALSSLGRKEDALFVWEQGHEHALCQSTDLKQLLELEDLLKFAKQDRNVGCENHVTGSGSSIDVADSETRSSSDGSENLKTGNKLDDNSNLCIEAGDTSETRSKCGDDFEIQNATDDEVGGRFAAPVPLYEPRINGNLSETCPTYDASSVKSKFCSEPRDGIELRSKGGDNFVIPRAFSDTAGGMKKGDNVTNGDTSEIGRKASNRTDIHNEGSEGVKRSKNICVTRISKFKSISVDFRLSRGIAQVNEGKYASAISIFDQILKEDPTYPEALIGRGTAYAFQRELEAAIADFSKAIQSNPSADEAWKRRGQARAALGEAGEAIQDLTKALEFEPNSADILHERGIVNFKFKDFDGAVEDLSACVTLDEDNKSALTYLGLALSSSGEYKRAEEAHLKSLQLDRNFLEAWAHLAQFYQDLAKPTKALESVQQVLQIDAGFAKAYHLRGLLLHGMGEHKKAIKDLSVGLSIESSNIECLYIRASCYHAIGEYKEAVKDYDAALDLELDSMDKFVLQCLAFYQKEVALYTASKLNSEFCWFDIDGDLAPLFKEYWCKRLHPKNVCEKVFRQPPLKRAKLRKQDFAITKQKTVLLSAADLIGQKIQYDCPGFLPNKRQHRMAGLAAIEIAQKVSRAWRSLHNSSKNTPRFGKRGRRRANIPSQNRGGAGCSTTSSAETSTSHGIAEDRSSARSIMLWQDVYSLALKWRQISEPCDPVMWVNRLSEEFDSGFGSHTPMILGQAKVVRYYPNFGRTFNVAKTTMMAKLYVHNKADDIIRISEDEKLQEIMDAKTCSDLYNVVGEDFWLATQCNSTSLEGKQLEGTRITVVKTGERGFDFAIRTPSYPSRWDEFDAEMAVAWEAVCNAYCSEVHGSTDFDVLENVRDAILRMTYYWYNFMPLSRGSAAVGFIVLLGLLLAASMEFTGKIPKGFQVDWEAILDSDPNSFVDSVKGWLYPSLKVTTSLKDYPDVGSTLGTTGSVVAALSSYDN